MDAFRCIHITLTLLVLVVPFSSSTYGGRQYYRPRQYQRPQQYERPQQHQSSQCPVHTESRPHQYHAPPRAVEPPSVDSALRKEFLLMFHREGSPNHKHSNPHDMVTEMSSLPAPINATVLDEIVKFCPRDTFFYSFSPRHQNAIMLLQREFIKLQTPKEVLRVAKHLLQMHRINGRVWFYALLGANIMNPKLNGYNLAWAIDATPDLFIPFSILKPAIAGSSRPFPRNPTVDQCRTALGRTSKAISFPISQNQVPRNSAKRSRRLIKRLFGGGRHRGGGHKGYHGSYGNYNGGRGTVRTTPRPGGNNGKHFGRGQCIVFNGTKGVTSGEENKLWYFREDMYLTQHHWYWHQYFPQMADRHPDRRGENFYFSHHNIIARYNAERLSNGLPLVEPLNLRLGEDIGVGYDADLFEAQSGKFWTPREAKTPLSNVDHVNDPDFELGVTMNQIAKLYQTMVTHIKGGYLIQNRTQPAGKQDIKNPKGLGDLANTIEAAEELSVNPDFYHNYGIHNLGHIALAIATDPDYRCKRPTGVLADLTVTFRDPAFYKNHKMVDDLFDLYKSTLPPYQINSGEWPLLWSGVKIQSLEVLTGQRRPQAGNLIRTFWSIRRFPIEEGIDGSIHEGDVETEVCQQHLNHEPFTFKIVVEVKTCSITKGTMRIYMAPRHNLNGKRFEMKDTRQLMFLMDVFPVNLKRGINVITRRSQDSSSTKPFPRTLKDMLRDPDNGGKTEYCGCGWPSHMYVIKGNTKGMEFDLFAMVTNHEEDKVIDSPEDLKNKEPCNSPYLFCGIPFRKYPDARPMGYPFDRHLYSVNAKGNKRTVKTIEEYVSNVPNMKSTVVTIRHTDTIYRDSSRS